MDIRVSNYKDFVRLEDAVKNGDYELRCDVKFASVETGGADGVYVFEAGDDRFFLYSGRVDCVFTLLDATVSYETDEHTFTFDRDGMAIDGEKKIAYKYDYTYSYYFDATCYRSYGAYKVLAMLCDEFWRRHIIDGMKTAGYID